MGEKFRRFELTGVIKFCIDDMFEDNVKALKKRVKDPRIFICDDIVCSLETGRAKVIISKIENKGICGMDEFYAQRKKDKAPEAEPVKDTSGTL